MDWRSKTSDLSFLGWSKYVPTSSTVNFLPEMMKNENFQNWSEYVKVLGGLRDQKQWFWMHPSFKNWWTLKKQEIRIEIEPGRKQERRKQCNFDLQNDLHRFAVRLASVSLKSVGYRPRTTYFIIGVLCCHYYWPAADWWIDWLAEWVAGWLVGSVGVLLLVFWVWFGIWWVSCCLAGWVGGWLAGGWVPGWLGGLVAEWLAEWLSDWLGRWLAGDG